MEERKRFLFGLITEAFPRLAVARGTTWWSEVAAKQLRSDISTFLLPKRLLKHWLSIIWFPIENEPRRKKHGKMLIESFFPVRSVPSSLEKGFPFRCRNRMELGFMFGAKLAGTGFWLLDCCFRCLSAVLYYVRNSPRRNSSLSSAADHRSTGWSHRCFTYPRHFALSFSPLFPKKLLWKRPACSCV